MRARLVLVLASLVLGGVAVGGCGGASGEPAATSASSSGGEGEGATFDPSSLDPAAQERIAANQQGRRAATGAAPGAASATDAPSEADVLGRQGYTGSGVGGGGGGLVIGGDPQHPVPTCGASESYLFVARDFQCPGGGPNPFGGVPSAAAQARRGNVGPHAFSGPRTGDPLADAHIVDVYEVPCPGGPVEVYVCMYHCAP